MLDYQIQPNTRPLLLRYRTRAETGRAAAYSVLLDEDGKFVRRDYECRGVAGCAAVGALQFWVGRIPTGDVKKRPPIDDELLHEVLHAYLEGEMEPRRVNFPVRAGACC